MQPAPRLRPRIDLRHTATAHRWVSLAIAPLLALIVSFLMTHDEALAAGGTIGNGENVTGSIVSGQVDVWTFTATTGDSIWVSASETNVPNTAFVPRIDVIAPDASTDEAATFGDLFARVSFRATQTGTYSIKVQQQTATNIVGTYVLTLAKAPGTFVVPAGDDGGPIANGANVTGSLFRGDMDQWSFTANKDDSIWVSASEVGLNTAFVPRVDVYGPDGTDEAATFGDLFARVSFRAPLTGTYTIVVQQQTATDIAGLTYTLTLAKAPGAFVVPAGDDGGPIANGANVTGSLFRGDIDLWSFSANQGDSIWVSASEANTPNTDFVPRVDVYGPDGTDEAATFGDLFARVSFRAPLSGTYTIVVQQQTATDTAGLSYVLRLAKAPGAFVVPAGDEGGTIVANTTVPGSVARGDMDLWSFSATQGNQIEVTASETNTPNTDFVPRVDVYGPDGTDEAATFGDLFARVTFNAPQSGTYTIVVQQQTATETVGTYALEMTGAVPVTQPPINTLPAPIRIIDTRTLGSGPIASGTSRCFAVAGVAGIPADAGAVVLNVTAVGYGTNGWLTVYPNGQSVPATSTLNFDVHEYAMANGAIMRIGDGGQVCVNVGTVNNVPGSAQVILDASGYLTTDDLALLSMLSSPQRVVDTRGLGGPIATGASRCFPLAGVAGIPSDAAAVVVNVTAVGYPTQGWLTAYPSGQAVPGTSTLNFDTTEYAIANGTIIRIGTSGQVCVNVGTVNSAPGSSQVILDVTGYLTASGLASLPMLSSPLRVVDTRTSGGAVASGQSRCFTIAGLPGIPSSATALVLNLTAVGYGRQGWLTAYPAGQAVPATSTLNFDTTEYAMANGAVMAVGTGGQVCVNVGTVNSAPGNANIIIDVVGYR